LPKRLNSGESIGGLRRFSIRGKLLQGSLKKKTVRFENRPKGNESKPRGGGFQSKMMPDWNKEESLS